MNLSEVIITAPMKNKNSGFLRPWLLVAVIFIQFNILVHVTVPKTDLIKF